jgi:CRP/FNR family transcriptional regulator, cyclic AMP receptor protein
MDIRKLFDTAENVEVYSPGDIIFREGDQAHHMYVVLDGTIELQVAGHKVGTAQGGDLMGEMAIVGSHKRTATAVATTACRLAPVTERRFVLLVQETPYFALHVMKVLTDRIVRKEHEMRAGAP